MIACCSESFVKISYVRFLLYSGFKFRVAGVTAYKIPRQAPKLVQEAHYTGAMTWNLLPNNVSHGCLRRKSIKNCNEKGYAEWYCFIIWSEVYSKFYQQILFYYLCKSFTEFNFFLLLRNISQIAPAPECDQNATLNVHIESHDVEKESKLRRYIPFCDDLQVVKKIEHGEIRMWGLSPDG